MKTLAALALVAMATAAQAATDYPPGLFEKSPEIGADASPPTKRWTHMPDGRWMFVDPGQTQGKMCDFEGKCYPDTAAPPAAPEAIAPPVAANPSPLADDPPLAAPPPSMADSPMCDEIRHRLFQSWHELQQAHQLCGP